MPFGGPELIIVLAIALLIFGPKKLPEMGASIGKSIKAFKKGINDLNEDKKEDESKKSIDAARLELDAIERELANKKAALAAQEASKTDSAL